jgi:hypothetical protein
MSEVLKHKASEFGGTQDAQLTAEAIKQRLCCARGCGWNGATQIWTPDGLRVMCAPHTVLIMVMLLGLLGDPAPIDGARALADRLRIDWSVIIDQEPKQPCSPESFICLNCGGRMMAETVGMYSGHRWIHTCGVSKNER